MAGLRPATVALEDGFTRDVTEIIPSSPASWKHPGDHAAFEKALPLMVRTYEGA